jgi:hypothetical protein
MQPQGIETHTDLSSNGAPTCNTHAKRTRRPIRAREVKSPGERSGNSQSDGIAADRPACVNAGGIKTVPAGAGTGTAAEGLVKVEGDERIAKAGKATANREL